MAAATPAPSKVLVFSRTTGFRHPSIEPGVAAIRKLGDENGFAVDHTEDAAAFTADNLAQYRAVVFPARPATHSTAPTSARPSRSTSARAAVSSASTRRRTRTTRRRRSGRGSDASSARTSADTRSSPRAPDRRRVVRVRDHHVVPRRRRDHRGRASSRDDAPRAGVGRVAAALGRHDEFYGFATNPRGTVHVLASLDESTYLGLPRQLSAAGTMGEDHPIAWCHPFDGGRAFYTALGHDDMLYANDAYLKHVLGGILWATGAVRGDCG